LLLPSSGNREVLGQIPQHTLSTLDQKIRQHFSRALTVSL
jgi:hypothetical protein